jgi:protein-L-isoaspartate(D-aspartate) O-methyltransferase
VTAPLLMVMQPGGLRAPEQLLRPLPQSTRQRRVQREPVDPSWPALDVELTGLPVHPRLAAGQPGYDDRVTVVRADAQQGLPGYGEFAAIIVTVGAWDISPAWLDQLARNGTLVVPLRMDGVTRSVAFHRDGDHLVSESAEVCGFVPMQGGGQHQERVVELPDANGHHVQLRFDEAVPEGIDRLDGVLATGRTEVWSGVTIPHGTSFADLHLWNAGYLPGFCQVIAEDGTELAAERGQWFPYGVVREDSFAYLAVRPALRGAGVEFGARAYGRHGERPATAMVEQIREWDRTAGPPRRSATGQPAVMTRRCRRVRRS